MGSSVLTLISMLVGSDHSTRSLVEVSISSILSNIGTDNFLLVIGISSRMEEGILKCVNEFKRRNKNSIVIIPDCRYSFAQFTNHVFLKYGSGSKWFIVSHDDVQIETKDLVSVAEQSLQPFLDKVGWISFTDNDYLTGHWAPSTRPGYHCDVLYEKAWSRRKLFQFHSLEEDYWKKDPDFSTLAYDFPHSVVRCHAPFSHFIMVETEKLKKIGLCEEWSEVSLLIDEDWGLSALKEDLFNVWVPHIVYRHCRTFDGTRASPIIAKKGKQVGELFSRKWGFVSNASTKDEVNKIKRMYGSTNIPWSIDKNSFNWEYLR